MPNGLNLIPPQNENVRPTLEILPGLVVQPRFINGNWYLIPIGADGQLPDVEGMIIKDLAEEISEGDMTFGDKCCLIEALASRRKANIDALRNVMGLLGTDKPMPLTEIPPLALVESDDRNLNDLPTAESTGIQQFDFIEYIDTQFQAPETIKVHPTEWTWIDGMPNYFQTFKHGEHIRVWLEDKLTGERISDILETVIQHWQYEFPERLWHGWPFDRYTFIKPSIDSAYFNTNERSGPYGRGDPTYGQLARDDPIVILGDEAYPDLCCVDARHDWPGGDAAGLWISAVYRAPGGFGPDGDWHFITNQVAIVIERIDFSSYGVDLTLGYYNHQIKDLVLESRKYAQNYPHQSLMLEVANAEIILLDKMRLDGLLNGPQYVTAKQILENYKTMILTW